MLVSQCFITLCNKKNKHGIEFFVLGTVFLFVVLCAVAVY